MLKGVLQWPVHRCMSSDVRRSVSSTTYSSIGKRKVCFGRGITTIFQVGSKLKRELERGVAVESTSSDESLMYNVQLKSVVGGQLPRCRGRGVTTT